MPLVLGRVTARAAAAALQRWISAVATTRTQRELAMKSAGRMLMGFSAKAFRRWKEVLIEAQELRCKLGIALGRFRNREISAAWARWSQRVQHTRAARRALVIFVKRAQAAAFSAWRHVWEVGMTDVCGMPCAGAPSLNAFCTLVS